MTRRRLSAFARFINYSEVVEYTNETAVDHRRLSDGPCLPSLRRPYPYQYYRHPGEFGGSETCMLKRKNSSLGMIIDSTSSMMRTASTTFQCLLGSARRASYCGQPDPSVQLAPNGTSGSLYIRSNCTNSNESSLSNVSFDEQRRTVTIYDGRIPTTPVAPTIPFELMTPLEAITKTIEDPVESFVQIVLEAPDDKPAILPPVSTSSTHMTLPVRRRHRSSSPKSKPSHHRPNNTLENSALPKLTQHHSTPTNDSFNSTKVHYRAPEIVEPMDFSFLEPVLRGESAAPPSVPTKSQAQSLVNSSIRSRRISSRNSSTTEDSAIDIRTPSSSSNRTTMIDDGNKSSLESLSGDNHDYYKPPTPRLKRMTITSVMK